MLFRHEGGQGHAAARPYMLDILGGVGGRGAEGVLAPGRRFSMFCNLFTITREKKPEGEGQRKKERAKGDVPKKKRKER